MAAQVYTGDGHRWLGHRVTQLVVETAARRQRRAGVQCKIRAMLTAWPTARCSTAPAMVSCFIMDLATLESQAACCGQPTRPPGQPLTFALRKPDAVHCLTVAIVQLQSHLQGLLVHLQGWGSASGWVGVWCMVEWVPGPRCNDDMTSSGHQQVSV